MTQRLKSTVLREWSADRSFYVEVTVKPGDWGIGVWKYVLDPRKRQYQRKPKYWQRSGGWATVKAAREFATDPRSAMWKTALELIEKAGLTSSVAEHPPRKRECAGSSPASGSQVWWVGELLHSTTVLGGWK